MEYSIGEAAELSGVSTRTLRYYHSIGLLQPARINESGYRFYGEKEMEWLQQILFYRERGFSPEKIRAILYEKDFDILAALEEHLRDLEKKQAEMDRLLATVKKTIAAERGEQKMTAKERFEGFKGRLVRENEIAYGAELREKYGTEEVEAANRKLLQMTEGDYERFQNLKGEVEGALQRAVLEGADPCGEVGRRIVALHKEWLSMTWKEYSENAHRGLAAIYVMDERFTVYYDREIEGCARFLRDAVLHWVVEPERK